MITKEKKRSSMALPSSFIACAMCLHYQASCRTKHMGLELPFCSRACSEALCRALELGPEGLKSIGPQIRRLKPEKPATAPTEEEKRRAEEALANLVRQLDNLHLEAVQGAPKAAGEKNPFSIPLPKGAQWKDIPAEIRLIIFGRFSAFELLRIARTSPDLSATVYMEGLWKPIYDRAVVGYLRGMPKLVMPTWREQAVAYLSMFSYVLRNKDTGHVEGLITAATSYRVAVIIEEPGKSLNVLQGEAFIGVVNDLRKKHSLKGDVYFRVTTARSDDNHDDRGNWYRCTEADLQAKGESPPTVLTAKHVTKYEADQLTSYRYNLVYLFRNETHLEAPVNVISRIWPGYVLAERKEGSPDSIVRSRFSTQAYYRLWIQALAELIPEEDPGRNPALSELVYRQESDGLDNYLRFSELNISFVGPGMGALRGVPAPLLRHEWVTRGLYIEGTFRNDFGGIARALESDGIADGAAVAMQYKDYYEQVFSRLPNTVPMGYIATKNVSRYEDVVYRQTMLRLSMTFALGIPSLALTTTTNAALELWVTFEALTPEDQNKEFVGVSLYGDPHHHSARGYDLAFERPFGKQVISRYRHCFEIFGTDLDAAWFVAQARQRFRIQELPPGVTPRVRFIVSFHRDQFYGRIGRIVYDSTGEWRALTLGRVPGLPMDTIPVSAYDGVVSLTRGGPHGIATKLGDKAM